MSVLKNLSMSHDGCILLFSALGCETFSDGSPIIVLNKTKCEENLECLGGKAINLRKIRCNLSQKKSQYLHNGTWKTLQIKNGSFTVTSMDKTSLKVGQTQGYILLGMDMAERTATNIFIPSFPYLHDLMW